MMVESQVQLAGMTRSEAVAKLEDAEQLARDGRNDAAVAMAGEAAAAQPDDAEIQHRAAVVERRCGRPDDALPRFLRAVAAQPDFHWSEIEIGSILSERGDLDGALEWFRKAIQSEPGYFVSTLFAAMTERRLGRPEEARRLLAGAHAGEPANALIAEELARTLIELGDDAALVALRAAVPDGSEAAGLVAAALDARDQHAAPAPVDEPVDERIDEPIGGTVSAEEWIAGLEAAVAADPGDIEAIVRLGQALRLAGRIERAGTVLVGALAVEPLHRGALHELSQVYSAQGRAADALAVFEQAGMDPDRPDQQASYGHLLAAAGFPVRAETAYRRSLERDAGQADVHGSLAALLLDQERLKEALASAEAASSLAPHDPDHVRLRDRVRARLAQSGALDREARGAPDPLRTGAGRNLTSGGPRVSAASGTAKPAAKKWWSFIGIGAWLLFLGLCGWVSFIAS